MSVSYNTKYRLLSFVLVFLTGATIFYSCSSDNNDEYIGLTIETNPDSFSLLQNNTVEIDVFLNDLNIPETGSFSLSNPLNGTVSILDINNTSQDLSDDVILYTPNNNFVGSDEFTYTICNNQNTDSCKEETVSLIINSASLVNYNLGAMPYDTLSEYNFFEGELKNLEATFGVLPYELNATLFSDYAKKKRFLWMPSNTKAIYNNDDIPLDFPTGAILIKNFYYDNVIPNNQTKIIETRLMIKKEAGWVFANYVWNEDQTEAFFDLNGSFVDLQFLGEDSETNTLQYRIPSGAECHTCHKVMEVSQPIGPKPRNLNLLHDYGDGIYNQLNKLVSIGYLENSLPNEISKLPNYNDTTQPLELRARAYLDINCAHCHSDETHCAYRPMRFDYSLTEDFTNIGVCVDPDTDIGQELLHIVEPGDARHSVLHYRLRSEAVSFRMPLLGRTVNHLEGIELIELWIDSLTITCD